MSEAKSLDRQTLPHIPSKATTNNFHLNANKKVKIISCWVTF
jgi:hypothetical protein